MRRMGWLALAALVASGCVWEDRCTAGAARDDSGRCRSDRGDAGRDGQVDEDGGEGDAGPRDGGTDGGTDAGRGSIVDFAVGAAHVCVVDSRGVLTCWGGNTLGQLATGDVSPQLVPRRVEIGAAVLGVAGNSIHVCAHTGEPALYCWGTNGDGQVGNGTRSAAPVTTPFRLELGGVRFVSGSFANTCMTTSLMSSACWGRNDYGQLGIGLVSASPQPAPGTGVQTAEGNLEEVTSHGIGDRHVCLLTRTGTVFCMGRNQEGQCGLETPDPVVVATEVPGLTDVTSLSVSYEHSCAVQNGSVYCWGVNEDRQVVPGAPTGDPVRTPTVVTGLGTALQVAAGGDHTCALLDTREVACWGTRAHGALGDGEPVSDTTVDAPVLVSGLSEVERVLSSFQSLVCALTMHGELWCWGEDAAALVGGAAGATVFLDGETVHTAPVRVDPFR